MTAYHTAYFAHELTQLNASENIPKLRTSLSNARVHLNPHQLDAALSAFRSPLSRGAILADEVGRAQSFCNTMGTREEILSLCDDHLIEGTGKTMKEFEAIFERIY